MTAPSHRPRAPAAGAPAPAPAARLGSGMGRRDAFALTLAGGCHLAFLATVAIYIAAYYPGAVLPVLALLGCAVISETCPPAWKRWLFGEILLVVAALATFVAFVEVRTDSFQGWLRMVLAYWLLVPSRVGLLRWLLSLVIAELLILGAGHARFLDLPGLRLPLAGRTLLASPLLLLAPLGIGSVAVDSWLSGVAAARVRGARPPAAAALLRWSALPAIALAALLLTLGPGLVRHEKRVMPKVPHEGRSGVREPVIRPGEAQWVVKDPTPRARLLWEDPSQPQLAGVAYLRAYTLPRIAIEGAFVSWKGGPLDALRRAPGAFDPTARFAWAVRLPMGSDAVLHADGARGVDLEELLADRHGNLYVGGFDEIQRAYRVNLDPPDAAVEEDPDTYTDLPAELDALPWSQLEDPAWRGLDAVGAAAAIADRLGDRCAYDLRDLPQPAAEPAGILRTFLFGPPADRRGHCQYFASSAAILLRRLGHPARCVSGYASDERDQDGYTFRGLHAHAWAEVRDADGRWQRVDATPPGHLATRERMGLAAEGAGPADERAMALPGKPAVPPPIAGSGDGGTWLAWLALGGIAAAGAWTLLRRRRGAATADPVLAELARQNENLVRVAQQLGVAVAPHTTLSALAGELSARTGVDLGRHLDAHLAARFGGGPLPEPWPLELLRSAGAARGPGRMPSAD